MRTVLSPLETIFMKCQNIFSGKRKKNISLCRLLKTSSRVLRVKAKEQLSGESILSFFRLLEKGFTLK